MVFKLFLSCSMEPAFGSKEILSEAQNLKLKKAKLIKKRDYKCRGKRTKNSLKSSNLTVSRDNSSTLKEHFLFSYVSFEFYCMSYLYLIKYIGIC